MKTIHRKRLAKLADYLDTLPRKKFNFEFIIEDDTCGAVGCAIGHCPNVFPKLVEYDPVLDTIKTKARGTRWYRGIAEELFGVSYDVAGGLFSPGRQESDLGPNYKDLDSRATPKQVSKLIRQFLKDPAQK